MKYVFFFPAFMILFFLTSCSSNEEVLWIEADGSGRHESTMDLSGIYPFLLMGLSSESEEEEDPSTAAFKELLQSASLDTVLNLASLIEGQLRKEGRSLDLMLDSLKSVDPEQAGISAEEVQSNLQTAQNLMRTNLRMQIEKSSSTFKITTINTFDDIAEFEEGGNFMETMMGLSGAPVGGQADMVQDLAEARTRFSLKNGKTLKVIRAGQPQPELSEEEQQQMQMVEGMLGDEPYRLTIHFPGKVRKRLNSKYATRTGKETVAIEIPQEDLKNPDLKLDLGIKFKGLKQ